MGHDFRRAAAGVGIQDRRIRAHARTFPRADLAERGGEPLPDDAKAGRPHRLVHLEEPPGKPWLPLVPEDTGAGYLAPTVHHHAHFRVWQRKGYDMNIVAPR